LNLLNLRFGKLVVISEVPRAIGEGKRKWLCQCDCGEQKIITTSDLRGHAISCGCSKRQAKPWKRIRPYEALFNHFRKCAKRPVSLTFEEFLEFVSIPTCHYCDDALVWTQHFHGGRCYVGANLDRKDNDGVYEKSNVVVCCDPCNRSKGNRFAYEEFKVMMDARKAYRLQVVA
jgi:hypothetical protein